MSTNANTPRRALSRPRPAFSGLNTASTPNLSASFQSPPDTLPVPRPSPFVRKQSLSSLTHGSLATIPDDREDYPLRGVLDDHSPSALRMARRVSDGMSLVDVETGDFVDVPGNMHGTVKFVGNVQGKKGIFAGVELSAEFASRGKNNGDVDGISYFRTSIVGAGIFLPINKATRRDSPTASTGSFPHTPNTSSFGSSRMGNPKIQGFTPPTPSIPSFSQSVGPGRVASPQFKRSRPSLSRPESPLRRPQLGGNATAPRPSIGTPNMKSSVRYAPSPTPGKFSQSVRGTRDVGDPAKRMGMTPKPGEKGKTNIGGPRSTSALGGRSASALSQRASAYSDDDNTPVGTARTTDQGNTGPITSFSSKMQPVEARANAEEITRLKTQLEERDRQLKEQASSLAEMESSLGELQTLIGGSDSGSLGTRGGVEDRDVSQLRAALREKNEKIAMLTAEFDAHRADFRSTIDTLELASTETERVYEQRVQDLLREVQDYQDRSEDVDSVARQLKQLEELVQELEEGLEDARRGEAEARGEVEFLRGEVERGRSELRREREKAAAAQDGTPRPDSGAASKEVEQRDDEIRGLKAIIHSLSRDAIPENPELQRTPTQRSGSFSRLQRFSQEASVVKLNEKLERDLTELRQVVDSKTNREDELEREVERLRRGGNTSATLNSHRSSALTVGSNGTATQDNSSVRDSKSTVVSWRERDLPRGPVNSHSRGNTLETMPESDTYSSATDSSALWCEICETGGHDILTCTNMFGSKEGQAQQSNGDPNGPDFNVRSDSLPQQHQQQQRTGKDAVIQALSPKIPNDDFKPAPLVAKKTPLSTPVTIMPNPMDLGPVAGKESGVIDVERWCALCERDGHESVDCPFEDAF